MAKAGALPATWVKKTKWRVAGGGGSQFQMKRYYFVLTPMSERWLKNAMSGNFPPCGSMSARIRISVKRRFFQEDRSLWRWNTYCLCLFG